MLNGTDPAGRELGREAMELAIKALGQPYKWATVERYAPVYFVGEDGTYGFVTIMRVGIILTGTDEEVRARVARGLFDRVYYVRAKAPYKNGAWEKGIVRLLEQPALEVPALPEGGPGSGGERVRGWSVAFDGETPQPPVGSGLNLSDEATLAPLIEQLSQYPPEAIIGADDADPGLVVSTQFLCEAAVVADRDAVGVLIIRTVNAYRRAPWMDTLWKSELVEATAALDDGARAAGVAPERVATQRLLLTRGSDGWQVAEAKVYQQAYSLAVEPPTPADRIIGGLETVQVQVPPQLRRAEPVDPVTEVMVTVGATVVLAAWAGAAALGVSARSAQLLRQMGTESTGSRLARYASDALDWALSPLEKPLSRGMEKLGLSRYFRDDAPVESPEAVRVPAGDRGYACSACGSPAAEDWGYCTGCGAHLAAGVTREAAAAADPAPPDPGVTPPPAAVAPADGGEK